MPCKLIHCEWKQALQKTLACDPSAVRLVCPFIQLKAIKSLLDQHTPDSIQVITRFSLDDFALGVNDLAAMSYLLRRGARIRGVKNLHTKLYLFGSTQSVVTSANLTMAALTRNHELGVVADDPQSYADCRNYFDALWNLAGDDLVEPQLQKWKEKVEAYRVKFSGIGTSRLGDEGVDALLEPNASVTPSPFAMSTQAFVKFFGNNSIRADHTTSVLAEVAGSGSHWACSYHSRPRQVMDGATMYMGRLVSDPNDILIYGRGIGMQHIEGRDDASEADIAKRPWKQSWPRYVRVHHPEFVAGTLQNGVSLNQLMNDLGSDSFATTQKNARSGGDGNTDPRRTYRRQPSVRLSAEGNVYLHDRFEASLLEHGRVPQAELANLDLPSIAGGPDSREREASPA